MRARFKTSTICDRNEKRRFQKGAVLPIGSADNHVLKLKF